MIKITSYKSLDKGALQGSLCCEVEKWKLQFNDIMVFKSGGRRWIGMPSRKIEKPGEDKPSYFPYVKFTDRDVDNRFQAAVLAALDTWLIQNPPQPSIHSPSSWGEAPAIEANHNESVPF